MGEEWILFKDIFPRHLILTKGLFHAYFETLKSNLPLLFVVLIGITVSVIWFIQKSAMDLMQFSELRTESSSQFIYWVQQWSPWWNIAQAGWIWISSPGQTLQAQPNNLSRSSAAEGGEEKQNSPKRILYYDGNTYPSDKNPQMFNRSNGWDLVMKSIQRWNNTSELSVCSVPAEEERSLVRWFAPH